MTRCYYGIDFGALQPDGTLEYIFIARLIVTPPSKWKWQLNLDTTTRPRPLVLSGWYCKVG